MTTLSKSEMQALVNKFRRNTFGNYSAGLIDGLIAKGLVAVGVINAKNRRLTEAGIAAVEAHLRRS